MYVLDFIFAVGSQTSPQHAHTELYDFSKSSWVAQRDYPFHSDVSSAPVVNFESSFLIFGGYDHISKQTDVIAQFKLTDRSWSNLGTLVSAKWAHNAIQVNETQFLVVGGFPDAHTEMCTHKNGAITCTTQEPNLSNEYRYYPELYPVEDNYCQ